jgi:type I restriction enzyme, R subunit
VPPATGLPDAPPPIQPLPFLYQSTGIETRFTNGLDPSPRSRRVFDFHRPETLADWLAAGSSPRTRLHTMPPIVETGFWPAQLTAVRNLERSLREDRPRALIQMATGSGKTYTAISSIYRLIKFGGAKRVLFLVDRANLGRQALKDFQQYVAPDDGRKFTELYNVQLLTSNKLDPVARVCITTIQRLYRCLKASQTSIPHSSTATPSISISAAGSARATTWTSVLAGGSCGKNCARTSPYPSRRRMSVMNTVSLTMSVRVPPASCMTVASFSKARRV